MTDITEQLGALAIPIPALSDEPPAADIPPVAQPDEPVVDFGTPRKRSRRRKPTAPAPEVQTTPAPDVGPATLTPVEAEQIGKALGVGFRVIFAIVASKRGQHWQLSPEDEKLLGITWTDALGPWLLSNSKYVPLAVATLATVGVIMPRMDVDARQRPTPEPIRNPDVPPAAPTGIPNDAAAPSHSA